jgi:hypothetical protein
MNEKLRNIFFNEHSIKFGNKTISWDASVKRTKYFFWNTLITLGDHRSVLKGEKYDASCHRQNQINLYFQKKKKKVLFDNFFCVQMHLAVKKVGWSERKERKTKEKKKKERKEVFWVDSWTNIWRTQLWP